MNTRVHARWIDQRFEWHRAIWIECGELMDHIGYKWWKRQSPDMDQVRLEIIDIWHFGLSALFEPGKEIPAIADKLARQLDSHHPKQLDPRVATEALALNALQTSSFSPAHFLDLMASVDMQFNELYSGYVGKNVLNFFRQDNGYKEGTYAKIWEGREDNEHLVELIATLDSNALDFADQLYAALSARYQCAGARS